MPLIFVDVEAFDNCPALGRMTQFGAVEFEAYHNHRQWVTFHGIIIPSRPSGDNPSVPEPIYDAVNPEARLKEVMIDFSRWLNKVSKADRPVFVSDNNGFDWQWINDAFWRTLNRNPFGHSSRRISDFYAGLMNDFRQTQHWKRLRITKHDHNPVHDCQGNVEAFSRMLNGER